MFAPRVNAKVRVWYGLTRIDASDRLVFRFRVQRYR